MNFYPVFLLVRALKAAYKIQKHVAITKQSNIKAIQQRHPEDHMKLNRYNYILLKHHSGTESHAERKGLQAPAKGPLKRVLNSKEGEFHNQGRSFV